MPKNGLSIENAGDNASQIKNDYPSSTDGLYWIQNNSVNSGIPFQIYADMSTDGGGWTLLLTNNAGGDWTYSTILENNTGSPSLSGNYSIIGYADYLKGTSNTFQYMLDASTRGHFGGIWSAPSGYSFTNTDNSQTGVILETKFGTWNYNDTSIEQRMPWVPPSTECAWLTTSTSPGDQWWGTLISRCGFAPAPWIGGDGGVEGEMASPGIIWYWVRNEPIIYNSGLCGIRYVGYHGDTPSWFLTAAPEGDTNNLSNIDNFSSSLDGAQQDYYSWEWNGYFKSSSDEIYTFYTSSDDGSYLWLGDVAVSGYSVENALVNNGGAHGSQEQQGATSSPLVSGQYYPIKIQFGELGGGDIMSVSFSTDTISQTTNGSGYFFNTSNCPGPTLSNSKFFLNSSNISSIKLGNNVISKIYLGENRVF